MAENDYDPMSYGAIRFNGEGDDQAKAKGTADGEPEDVLFGDPGDADGAQSGGPAEGGFASEWDMPEDIGHPLAGGGPDAANSTGNRGTEDAAEFGAGRGQFQELPGPLTGAGNAPEASLEDLIGTPPPAQQGEASGWEPLDELPGMEAPAAPASGQSVPTQSVPTQSVPTQPEPARGEPTDPRLAETQPTEPEPAQRHQIAGTRAPAPGAASASTASARAAGGLGRLQPVQRGHTGDTGKKAAAVAGRSKLDMMAMMARRRQRARILALLAAAVGLSAGAWFYYGQGQDILGGISAGLGVIGGLFLFVLMKD